jgi:glycosyltransferase involved in cell wall biosynthesis
MALGASPEKTSVVHLGIDTDLFVPGPPDSAMRERLGGRQGDTLVLAVGRLVEKKGFDVLLEGAARVDGLHVAIAGDGDLRDDLEQKAADLRVPVTFVGDIDQATVSGALAAADIVAVPSVIDRLGNVDGLPTTLLEAAAAGRPVVASDIAGIPEVITHGVNGLLVQPRDAEGLANALRQLRDDLALRHRLGTEARATAVQRFDWRASGQAFEHVYAKALDRRPS